METLEEYPRAFIVREGYAVMLLWKFDKNNRLCNGRRIQITHLHEDIIKDSTTQQYTVETQLSQGIKFDFRSVLGSEKNFSIKNIKDHS